MCGKMDLLILMVLEMFLIAEIKISDFGGWRGSLSDAACCLVLAG